MATGYVRIFCEPTRLKIAEDGLDVRYEDKRGLTVEADDEQVVLRRDGVEVFRAFFYKFLEPPYNVQFHSVKEYVCWLQECIDDIPPLPGDTINLLSVVTVDATVGGLTELFPVINNVLVEQVYAVLTEIDGGSGSGLYPEIQIGLNGGSNLYVPTKLLQIDELNDFYQFNTTAKKKMAVSGDKIDLTVNETSNATTYLLTIYYIGS